LKITKLKSIFAVNKLVTSKYTKLQMRNKIKNLLVVFILALSVFSYFYVNDIKTHQHIPMFSQNELSSPQYSENSERITLPESKIANFFIEKASALLSPVFKKN
jgi:hypothetical protein